MARAVPCPNRRLVGRRQYQRCDSCQRLRPRGFTPLANRARDRTIVRDVGLGRQGRGVHGGTIRRAPDAASEN